MRAIDKLCHDLEMFGLIREDKDQAKIKESTIILAKTTAGIFHRLEKVLPYFVVPASDGAIGIEYRIENKIVYYRFQPDGSIRLTAFDQQITKQLYKQNYPLPHNLPTPRKIVNSLPV